MRVSPVRIVLLGPSDSPLLESIEPALSRLPRSVLVERISDGSRSSPPRAAQSDLCIVLESWPDEIPLRTAHELIAACAASRLICCQGVWCASAGRTRATWPPAVCVPVEQFAARLAFELDVLAGRRAPLPATASRDEAFAAHYAFSPDGDPVSVFVDSPDAVYARELQRAFGTPLLNEACDVIIRDADFTADDPQLEDRRVKIAVAGFPRFEPGNARESSAGPAIVPKLAPLSELQSVIGLALNGRRDL